MGTKKSRKKSKKKGTTPIGVSKVTPDPPPPPKPLTMWRNFMWKWFGK